MECGRTQKIYAVAKTFTFQHRLKRNYSQAAWGHRANATTRPNGGKIKEDNARLLAQMPPSRESRKPGGNNRQERKDAVSGRENGKRGAGNTLARQQARTEKRSSAFGGKSQCVVQQRKSISSHRLANVTTLPTASVEVTRTRWHGQHAFVVATENVHPRGKNGKRS